MSLESVIWKAREARNAFLKLSNVSSALKSKALREVAGAIAKNKDEILEANKRDITHAFTLLQEGKLTKSLVDRLKLDEYKLRDIVAMVENVAELEDPVGKTTYAMELDEGLELYRVTCPIGVVAAIFESRPDVLPQIASLCLKSGNAVILKGGREAKESNRVLYSIVKEASEGAGVPKGWIQLIEERFEVAELLKLHEYVDLIVPRGGKKFIQYVIENTKIPVLGHSEGICHVYVDKHADLNKAVNICFDARVQYPAACNAMKILLVHKDIAREFLPRIAERYQNAGVEIRGCERTLEILKGYNVKRATKKDWSTEYLDLIIPIKVVENLEEAIRHVNMYGSKHTDSIVTEDRRAALKFMQMVDSSTVLHNASTRFSDGYRYGFGAEVGISTNKIHARGPVGLEGLMIYKYYLVGNGQIVADYLGKDARRFTHRKLAKTWDDVTRAYTEQ
jgi:glutamate-5-semialdehyde dehydrogenase